MPKSQYVDPGKAFESGYIHFEDIPVCQYNKTLAQEKKIYTKDDFLRIYRDMAIIREFETMLNEVKVKSEYNGVKYKVVDGRAGVIPDVTKAAEASASAAAANANAGK